MKQFTCCRTCNTGPDQLSFGVTEDHKIALWCYGCDQAVFEFTLDDFVHYFGPRLTHPDRCQCRACQNSQREEECMNMSEVQFKTLVKALGQEADETYSRVSDLCSKFDLDDEIRRKVLDEFEHLEHKHKDYEWWDYRLRDPDYTQR